MLKHKHNAGCGQFFCFHGAYREKSAAVKKESKTPGGFIKGIHYGVGDYRYAVLTRRKDAETNPVDTAIKLSTAQLAIRNKAFDWMFEHSDDYSSAQMLAQDASTKYGFPVSGLIHAARQLIPPGRKKNPFPEFKRRELGDARSRYKEAKRAFDSEKEWNTKKRKAASELEFWGNKIAFLEAWQRKEGRTNPLFTRGEKRKMKKKIRHAVKAAARRGIFRLLGIGKKTTRPAGTHSHRSTGRSSAVREDVISALINQGYSRKDAACMVPQAAAGEDFTNLFKRALKRNPDLTESERRAVKAFHDFHGKDPKKVIRMEETIIESGDYFLVGEFFGYDLTQFPIERFSQVRPNVYAEGAGIKLCAGKIEKLGNGKMVGHQLFVMGGNQDLEWALEKQFGITSGAQLLDLGEIKNIWYVARKKQDNFQRYHYHHTFGEEGGSRPYLMYDRVHKKQFIVGGDYSVPLEGIRN